MFNTKITTTTKILHFPQFSSRLNFLDHFCIHRKQYLKLTVYPQAPHTYNLHHIKTLPPQRRIWYNEEQTGKHPYYPNSQFVLRVLFGVAHSKGFDKCNDMHHHCIE